jgi:hypothetical protein
MTAARAAVLFLVVVMGPAPAAAQAEEGAGDAKTDGAKDKSKAKRKAKGDGKAKDDDKAKGKDEDKASEEEDASDAAAESPSGAPRGADENPKAPVTEFQEFSQPEVEVRRPQPPAPTEYPIERVLRQITLPERMTEVTLDAPNSFNPYEQSGLIGARHGITAEIQAGLRYGTGTLHDGEYFVGKAISVDGEYQVFDWLAAQLSLPMLVDPFSLGVTVGAPMKFTFFERLRLDLLRDLVTFKVSRFAPSVVDAEFNDAQVEADETNSVIEDGRINLNAGATWQLQRQIALEGRLGVQAPDFEFQSDSPTALDVGLIYSGSNKVDVGGRLGFADLNNTDESFGIWLLAALRI